MPVDASIPLQARPINATGKISELLGIGRQITDLKRAQAETEGAQQTQRQRAALAAFDISKIIGDDGTIDLNKIPDSGLREAAGDKFPEVLSQYAQVKQQQIAAKQSLAQLRDVQRSSFGTMLGALRSDPDVAQDTAAGRQKVAEAFSQFAGVYGDDVAPVLKAYAGPLQNAPQGKLGQVVQNIQLQATSAADQATRQAPQYTNTGGELKQTNPYAQSGQAPASIQNTVAPGAQDTPATGPDANLYVQKRDARGNIIGYEPAKGMPRYAVGEVAAITEASTGEAGDNRVRTTANREAARLAPDQLDQIRKARELSKQASTGGKWTAKRADLEAFASSLIPGLDSAQDDATKLQKLDKFLERIAATSSQVLGTSASTDAARESISRQNASIGYTPQAIQGVLDYAEAQTRAMQAKGNAQDVWFEQEGNGVKNQNKFESEWRRAYDPRIFQLEVASDESAQKMVAKLSKEEKAELRKKRGLLKQMGAME